MDKNRLNTEDCIQFECIEIGIHLKCYWLKYEGIECYFV